MRAGYGIRSALDATNVRDPKGSAEVYLLESAVEAVALGFASGPVCLASCGPVLLPWLAMGQENTRTVVRLLSLFLGGRLAGYLLFAVLAWAVGLALPMEAPTRALVFGLGNLLLAAILGLYVWRTRQVCPAASGPSEARLYQIDTGAGTRPQATIILGFLTGLNLCPPFIAAGVRAAEAGSLSGALVFFFLFFTGTAVWFLPAAAVTPIRRIPSAALVARIVLGLMAIYYAYQGIVNLSWRLMYA